MAKIQRFSFAPDGWSDWADADSVDDGIASVKGYCMGPGSKFRVVDDEGVEVFVWGPLTPWSPSA